MYETHRHQYLGAMGIDSYMPRRILTAAPLSRECEWPEQLLSSETAIAAVPALEPPLAGQALTSASFAPAQSSVTAGDSPHPVSTQPISAEVSKTANALLLDLGSEKITAAKPSGVELPSPTVDLAAAPESVNFTLSIWRLDKYLIVDQRESDKALPTEKLLLSMLRAINLPLANLPKAQILRWPMLAGGIADESAEAARDMLSVFFDTGTVEHHVWLLMGEAAQIALAESGSPIKAGAVLGAADLDARFSGPKALQIAILPSLVEMLEQPQLKAAAWQALRQL